MYLISLKTRPISGLFRGIAVVAGGLALVTGGSQAAPFIYGSGDLILTFRQSGNAFDYVVNLGKATNFTTLPSGTSLSISALSTEQLQAAFPSLNGLSWSIAAANRPPGLTDIPLQTIWVTSPRLDGSVPAPAWVRKGSFVLGTAASQIDALGNNSASSSSLQVAGPNNTATGVVIPVGSDYTVSPVLGDAGDYAGTFQGKVEAVTSDTFVDDASSASRADLYELRPGTSAAGTLNKAGQFLGYFELKPDGTLTFKVPSVEVPAPVISGIARADGQTTLSFSTVSGITYQVRYTDAAGLNSPVSTWTPGGSIVGTGSTVQIQDTSSSDQRFYAIEAQP